MEKSENPMCVTSMRINPFYFKSGSRLLGEIDLFLVKELPIKELLKLEDCPLDDFKETFTAILLQIGENLANRLMKNPNYRLIFFEQMEESGLLTHKQACSLWASLAPRWSIAEVWENVPVNKGVARQLSKILKEGLAEKQGNQMVYLYAILVYARTIVKQKGGGRKWKKLCPRRDYL